jgi:hypothetical protein
MGHMSWNRGGGERNHVIIADGTAKTLGLLANDCSLSEPKCVTHSIQPVVYVILVIIS